MIGILTEKPSAGRNFAKALGGVQGTYNGEQYVIVSARGHLYEFVAPEQQVAPALESKYKSWDLEHLPWNERDFNWKRTKKKDTSALIKQIKDVLSKCDEVVIATDIDPTGEGQLLAWEILDEAKIRPKKYSRMHFLDESVKSIQSAFVSRTPLQSMATDMEYVKAYYRARWDFMSMQFTRIATKCGDGRSVLRQGRLKSVIVKITGDGLAALKAYKAVPYYQNKFRDNNGNIFSNPKEPIFSDKAQVPNVYVDSAVIVDKKTMKSTRPRDLLDLAFLSSILSTRGVNPDEVLATYQKMYEAQVVSYPRTEDKCITPEQFAELLPKIDAIANVVGIDPSLLTHRTSRSTHVKTGGAHGANRPGLNVPKSLDDLRQYGSCAPAIYELLAKNYLAMLAEDYEYEHQEGHLERYPDFKGSANVPKKAGWKAIFSDMEDDDNNVDDKQLGTIASPFVYEGFPPKPPTPTMKWVMKQLEKHDVGTGSTRTGIFKEVISAKAKYPLLSMNKTGKLSMTEYGSMSYLLLKDTHIGDVKMTEQLQQDMRDIAAGKINPDERLHDVQQMVLDDIQTMQKNSIEMRKELGIVMSNSTATATEKEKFTGTWNGKAVSFNREWGSHRFTDDECIALCEGKEIEVNGLISKAGKPYGVRGKLAEQVYNGHKFVGFERTGFANDDKIPDAWCEHKFTDDEKLLLEAGKSVQLDGCVSKKGSVFACKVHWGKNDKGRMAIIPEW